MSDKKIIEHKGIVSATDSDFVYVKIETHSACAACHVKGVCNASDMQDKIIEVKRNENMKFNTGDEVNVVLAESLGYAALFLGYLLPFCILMAVLITTLSLSISELFAGLASVGILIPYYTILFFNKEVLRKKFEFRIKL